MKKYQLKHFKHISLANQLKYVPKTEPKNYHTQYFLYMYVFNAFIIFIFFVLENSKLKKNIFFHINKFRKTRFKKVTR